MKLTRKNIFLILGTSILFIIISVSFYFFKTKIEPRNIYKDFTSFAIEKELLTKSKVENCEAPEYCIPLLAEESLLNQRGRAIALGGNFDKEEINTIINLAKTKKYKKFLTLYKESINNNLTATKKLTNSSLNYNEVKLLLSETEEVSLGDSTFKVGYYFQINNFLLVNIEPNENITDPANAIYKRGNKGWTLILGPGTSFENEELVRLGIPSEIIKKIHVINITTPDVEYPPQDNSNIDPGLE